MTFKTLGTDKNFLGIEPRYSSFSSSKIVILPVPYECTTSYKAGTRLGPGAILEASHYVEFYDEEMNCELHAELGIATLEPLEFAGKKRGPLVYERALKLIYDLVRELIAERKFIATLGGEHTISIAPIRAHEEKYRDAEGGFSVLHFDAHSDLRQSYEGTRYSHASFMARVCEFLDPRKIVQVGIRALSKEEAEFIQASGIHAFYAYGIRDGKYSSLFSKSWEDHLTEKLSRNVYITFDVDCFDPSIMPATGTPEPNGLHWDEVMRLLRKVGEQKNIVGFDVVEFAPIKGLHHADLTAAKLVYKLLNYSFMLKRGKPT